MQQRPYPTGPGYWQRWGRSSDPSLFLFVPCTLYLGGLVMSNHVMSYRLIAHQPLHQLVSWTLFLTRTLSACSCRKIAQGTLEYFCTPAQPCFWADTKHRARGLSRLEAGKKIDGPSWDVRPAEIKRVKGWKSRNGFDRVYS